MQSCTCSDVPLFSTVSLCCVLDTQPRIVWAGRTNVRTRPEGAQDCEQPFRLGRQSSTVRQQPTGPVGFSFSSRLCPGKGKQVGRVEPLADAADDLDVLDPVTRGAKPRRSGDPCPVRVVSDFGSEDLGLAR